MNTIVSMNLDLAQAYSNKHVQHALLVMHGNQTLLEDYDNGHDAQKTHALYSGTKSFWGITALLACEGGLFTLDAPVADVITEWRDDPAKAQITPRMLLQMTAGFGFGGLGSAVPPYDRAIATPLKNAPGTTFTYGGIPLQVFGAYFARLLAQRGETPHAYLSTHILKPANVSVASWRTLKDGTHPLPTGAMLTARAWAAYGRFVIAQHRRFANAFVGSRVNPRYGLGWWLGATDAPDDLVYASGSAGQALYLVPSLDLVVVRFGNKPSYKHEAFLKRLFS